MRISASRHTWIETNRAYLTVTGQDSTTTSWPNGASRSTTQPAQTTTLYHKRRPYPKERLAIMAGQSVREARPATAAMSSPQPPQTKTRNRLEREATTQSASPVQVAKKSPGQTFNLLKRRHPPLQTTQSRWPRNGPFWHPDRHGLRPTTKPPRPPRQT